MYGDFVTFPVGLLDGRVVCIFVRDEECSFDIAPVRILALAIEHFFVKFDIIIVYGIVKSDCNHLRYVFGLQITWYHGAVFRAKTVWQHTLCGVAWWSSVGVVVDICQTLCIS